MTIEGVTGTFEQFRAGIKTPDGRRSPGSATSAPAGSRSRSRRSTANTNFTLEQLRRGARPGKDYAITSADGSTRTVQGDDMSGAFINSLAVTIPATSSRS